MFQGIPFALHTGTAWEHLPHEHGGLMWEYRAPGTSVRIIYTMTLRRTIVTVAYFEA